MALQKPLYGTLADDEEENSDLLSGLTSPSVQTTSDTAPQQAPETAPSPSTATTTKDPSSTSATDTGGSASSTAPATLAAAVPPPPAPPPPPPPVGATDTGGSILANQPTLAAPATLAPEVPGGTVYSDPGAQLLPGLVPTEPSVDPYVDTQPLAQSPMSSLLEQIKSDPTGGVNYGYGTTSLNGPVDEGYAAEPLSGAQYGTPDSFGATYPGGGDVTRNAPTYGSPAIVPPVDEVPSTYVDAPQLAEPSSLLPGLVPGGPLDTGGFALANQPTLATTGYGWEAPFTGTPGTAGPASAPDTGYMPLAGSPANAQSGSSQAALDRIREEMISLGRTDASDAEIAAWAATNPDPEQAAAGLRATHQQNHPNAQQVIADARSAIPSGPTDAGPAGAMPTPQPVVAPSTGTGTNAPWTYQGSGYVPPGRTPAPNPFTPSNYALPAYRGPGSVLGLGSLLGLLSGVPGYQSPGDVPNAQSEQELLAGLPAAQRGAGYAPTGSRADQLTPELRAYLGNWMAQPNRYETSAVQGTLKQIENQAERDKTNALADMDAYYASRGVTGGSPEWLGRTDLASRLDDNRLSAWNNLLTQEANAEAGDRAAAGNFGLGLGSFLQGQDAYNAGQNEYAYGTDYQAGRDFEGDTLNRANLGLGARAADNANRFTGYGFGQQNAAARNADTLSRASMALSAGSGDNANTLARYEMDQQNARDAETAGLNRAQFGQSALNADNQNSLATYDRQLAATQQAEAAREFDADNAYRTNAFGYGMYNDARNYGLSNDQLTAQIEAERAQNELARNSLGQNQSQFTSSQGQQSNQNDLYVLLQLFQQLGIS